MVKNSPPWNAFALCWLTGLAAALAASLTALFMAQIAGTFFDGSDKLLISRMGSWIQGAFLSGWAVGGIAIGFASDRIGRVKAMALALFMLCFFSGSAALSQGFWSFLGMRFLTGLGVGGAMVNMSLLVAERWPAPSRTLAVGTLLTSYQAGVFLSGTVAYYLPEWRLAFAAAGAPIVLLPLILLVLKEKPREKSEARETKAEIAFKPLLLGGLLFGSLLIAYWASLSWIPTWVQELSSGAEKSKAMMWHGILAMIGCLFAGPCVNRIGRIPTLFLCFILAFSLTVWMVWSHSVFSSWVYLEFSGVGLAVGMAQAVLYIYLPELFPAYTRGRDVGFCLNAGRFATVAAVLTGGIMIPLLGGYAQGITFFAASYLAAGATVLFCPEPKKEGLATI